jgi:hypothetical protein
MSRVLEVRDSRTVVVQAGGIPIVVVLRGVIVPEGDEASAMEYLKKGLAARWVFVENGEVYRSPDGLHVNDAMRRRAWLGATYMGELAFPDAARITPLVGIKPGADRAPTKRAKTRSRPTPRPRSSRQRSQKP